MDRTGSTLRLERGAAIVETIIAMPVLLIVILGAIQFGLVYQAKATLNHAGLQAARAGAVRHADPEAIRKGLARGLLPLYSPGSSLPDAVRTLDRVRADLATDARIRILNPTNEAFVDFGEHVNGVREIPNDRLHVRSTAIGPRSGLNIQDANLLRVHVTYGYELKVPFVNWLVARLLLAGPHDDFERQLLRRLRLPMTTTSTVRMQSAARESGLVVARSALPDVERFPAQGESGIGASSSGQGPSSRMSIEQGGTRAGH